MSAWHRSHPELIGTSADPNMQHEGYRKAMETAERECAECGKWGRFRNDLGLCPTCMFGEAA